MTLLTLYHTLRQHLIKLVTAPTKNTPLLIKNQIVITTTTNHHYLSNLLRIDYKL